MERAEQSEDNDERSRILCMDGDSGHWLLQGAHHLQEELFRIAAALRLGVNLDRGGLPRHCNSGEPINQINLGDHLIACMARHRMSRKKEHDQDVNQLTKIINECGAAAHVKVDLGLAPRPPGGQQDSGPPPRLEVDLSVDIAGQTIHIDFSRTHATGPRRRRAAVLRAGVAAKRREALKRRKYSRASARAGAQLYPLVYETYGRIGPTGKRFWKRLFKFAKDIGQRDADGSYSTWICKKRVQIAAVIARNQAMLVQTRILGLQLNRAMGRRIDNPYCFRYNNVGPNEFSACPR